MYIYIIMFFMIFLLRIILIKKNKVFCTITGFILWVLLAIRNEKIGINDTMNIYKPLFTMIQNMSFLDIIKYKWMSDKLFYFIMKISSLIINNFQICISILAIPYIWFVMNFIEKNSKKPLLSVLFFITLYYLYATFLLRQVIAIGICVYSIEFIERKKIKSFIITVLIASLFHRTSLIFLVAYPFSLLNKFSKKNYIYILIFFIISNLYGIFIINYLPQFDFTGKIAISLNYNIYKINSNEVSMFGLAITVAILIYTDFYRRKIKTNNKKIDIYMNISTLGSMCYTLSNVVAEFYRVALYFSIVNIILIPLSLSEEKEKNLRQIQEFFIIIILLAYFFLRTINNVNANPYMFFWG